MSQDRTATPDQSTDQSQRPDQDQRTDQDRRGDDAVAVPVRAPEQPSGPAAPTQPGTAPGQDSGFRQSQGPTGRGTFSYQLDPRQFDGDMNSPDADAALLQASRDLADATRADASGKTKAQRAAELPSIAGAIMLADGTIYTHTSMKFNSETDTGPNPHPLAQTLLDEVRAEIESRPDGQNEVSFSHGKCAETALVSDVLFDLASRYDGDPDGFRGFARAALEGSRITTHRIRSGGTSHGQYQAPCGSCDPFIAKLGITPVVDTDRAAPNQPSGPSAPSGPSVPSGPSQQDSAPPTSPGALQNAADNRPYDQPGGLTHPDPADQQALDNAVPRNEDGSPQRHPDPRAKWFGLVNDGGPGNTPFRANNCLDTALSFLRTWIGDPQVSAARTAEYQPDGSPTRAGERGGTSRAEGLLGLPFQHNGTDATTAYDAIADQLRAAGHGASALIITGWTGGGSHAWNAVNHNGTILWVDAQSSLVSENPIWPNGVNGVWSVPLDADGNPMTSTPAAPAQTTTQTTQPTQSQAQSPAGDQTQDTDDQNAAPDQPTNNDGPLDPLAEQERILDELSTDERAALDAAHEQAQAVAQRVMADLQSVADLVNRALPEDQAMTLLGTENMVKDLPSLARKYVTESQVGIGDPRQFLSEVNDLVRFSLRGPESESYGPVVITVLQQLVNMGYQVDSSLDVKNFWRPGNRFYGVNTTVTTPDGNVFELQFPTETSWRVGKETHVHYKTVRLPDEAAVARVEAFLRILAINKAHNIGHDMPGQDGLPEAKDTSLAKWISKEPNTWADYLESLRDSGETFTDTLHRFGLDSTDVPGVDPAASATTDGDQDVRVPRRVQDGQQRTADRPDSPGALEGSAPSGDLEPQSEGLDVQPGGSGSVSVRRSELGPDRTSGPVDGRTDRPESRDDAAERGGTAPDLRGGRPGAPVQDGGVAQDAEPSSEQPRGVRDGANDVAGNRADRGRGVPGFPSGRDLESPQARVDVQSDSGSSVPVRRPEVRPADSSYEVEGGRDRTESRDGTAERGEAAPDVRGGRDGEVEARALALANAEPPTNVDADGFVALDDGTLHEPGLSRQVLGYEPSFEDTLADRLPDGVAVEQFHNMRWHRPSELSAEEIAALRQVRDSVEIEAGVIVQRAMPAETLRNYLGMEMVPPNDGRIFKPTMASGFTTRYVDSAALTTPLDLFEGLRLDYD